MLATNTFFITKVKIFIIFFFINLFCTLNLYLIRVPFLKKGASMGRTFAHPLTNALIESTSVELTMYILKRQKMLKQNLESKKLS